MVAKVGCESLWAIGCSRARTMSFRRCVMGNLCFLQECIEDGKRIAYISSSSLDGSPRHTFGSLQR